MRQSLSPCGDALSVSPFEGSRWSLQRTVELPDLVTGRLGHGPRSCALAKVQAHPLLSVICEASPTTSSDPITVAAASRPQDGEAKWRAHPDSGPHAAEFVEVLKLQGNKYPGPFHLRRPANARLSPVSRLGDLSRRTVPFPLPPLTNVANGWTAQCHRRGPLWVPMGTIMGIDSAGDQ